MKKPEIVLVAAMTKDRVIGKDNKLPWHIPEDLQHFKSVTMNRVVVMGRKTWDSLGEHKLPGRCKVVLTRDPESFPSGPDVSAMTFTTIEDFYERFKDHRSAIIMGGAEIYQLFMPYADRIEMTTIFAEFEGDTYFPPMGEDWIEAKRIDVPADNRGNPHAIPFSYTTWVRTSLHRSKTRAFGFRPIAEQTTPQQDKATALASGALAWMRSVGDGFMDGFEEVLIRITKRPEFPEGGIVIGEHMATGPDYTLEKGKTFLMSFEDNAGVLLRCIEDGDEYEVFISKCQDTPYIVARERDASDPITDYFGINRTFQEDEVPSRFAYIEVHNLKE